MKISGAVGLLCLSAFALAAPPGGLQAQVVQVPGVGTEGQGADIVVLDLDPGGPDMILMAYDNPPGGNTFRYRVGKNLDANGVATGGWSAPIILSGVGIEGQGAGMAVVYLPGNTRPDLILMGYDNPPGANSFRYIIGRDLDANGIAASWSPAPIIVPGAGTEGQGAAAAVGRLNTVGGPELIFVVYDNPPGANTFRYLVGWDLGANGVPMNGWSPPIIVSGVGTEGQGAGAALINLDGPSAPELVLMAYDAPPGANHFRFMIGWNLGANGMTPSWTVGTQLSGLGTEGQGAGLAITCLDGNPRADWITMAYDAPPGANHFRYQVWRNLLSWPSCTQH